MRLRVLLPYGVFLDEEGVRRVVVDTRAGSFGLLPRRLDCVAALEPGILTYETGSGKEEYLAIDSGVLAKRDQTVTVAVRSAIGDKPLGQLHEAVREQFLNLDEREQEIRSVLVRLETRFIRQFQQMERP